MGAGGAPGCLGSDHRRDGEPERAEPAGEVDVKPAGDLCEERREDDLEEVPGS